MIRANSFRLAVVFGLFMVLSFSIAVFLTITGERISAKTAPLTYAAVEMKLHAALAHLWFEEVLSGDRSKDFDTVWAQLDRAQWYADAMLAGASNQERVFLPLEKPELRAHVTKARHILDTFLTLARDRAARNPSPFLNITLDQRMDQVFTDYLSEANLLERKLEMVMASDLSWFRFMSSTLVGSMLFVGLTIGLLILRLERRGARHLATIETANNEISNKNAALDKLAHFDDLTGLPNRVFFIERLGGVIESAQKTGRFAVLLFIDLDRFKSVNDQHGHSAGDDVLREASRRLRGCLQPEDFVARLGGDEFTVILSDYPSRAAAVEAARRTAEKLSRDLAEDVSNDASIHLEGKNHVSYVSASIGVAIYPGDGANGVALLKNADFAMYDAKQNDPGGYRFFSETLNKKMLRQLIIEQELRVALEQDQLFLQYQPQWDLRSGKIIGVEALVRWRHPKDGIRLPDSFISIAEATSLIRWVDAWVIRTACRQYRQWCDAGVAPARLSVNVSADLFGHNDLISTVQHSLAENGLAPGVLELELTETSLFESTTGHRRVMDKLIKQGVRLAIDDFGTGHSSFIYLRDYPVNTLKVDRTFVKRIPNDPVSSAILRSIVELADVMALDVVIEGVETEAQRQFLIRLGCKSAQGYLMSKPADPDEINDMLLQQVRAAG